MKNKQPKYYIANQDRYVTTFKQFIKATRLYPNSRISMLVVKGLPGSCVFFEGMYYPSPYFTNKQRKFLKDNFNVKPRVIKKGLGKFQRRQARLKFVKQWNGWKEDRRSQYIQAKARQAQRQSSAFPGCPTLQECLTEVIRDLSWIGCKDVYI